MNAFWLGALLELAGMQDGGVGGEGEEEGDENWGWEGRGVEVEEGWVLI